MNHLKARNKKKKWGFEQGKEGLSLLRRQESCSERPGDFQRWEANWFLPATMTAKSLRKFSEGDQTGGSSEWLLLKVVEDYLFGTSAICKPPTASQNVIGPVSTLEVSSCSPAP